jgi:hypothetical protein
MSSDKGGDPNAFLADYKSEGGWYNEDLFGLARYPGMGLGGQALQDIDVCQPHPLGQDEADAKGGYTSISHSTEIPPYALYIRFAK